MDDSIHDSQPRGSYAVSRRVKMPEPARSEAVRVADSQGIQVLKAHYCNPGSSQIGDCQPSFGVDDT